MNSNVKAGRGLLPTRRWELVLLSVFVLGICVAAALPARTQSVSERFVGVFTLAKYAPHGDKPTGRLSYDSSGRMWIMLLPPDRHPLSRSSAPEEYRDTMRRVVAYYGTYKIDEATGRVIHHVEEATNPAWIGEDFIRWYAFDGSDLFLSLNPDFDDPLLWKRLPESPDGHRPDQ